MNRRIILRRVLAVVTLLPTILSQTVSERVVQLSRVVGPRGEEFMRDLRSGGMWLVSRDYTALSTWVYGADKLSQASFRELVAGARVFVDGVEWDVVHFPP